MHAHCREAEGYGRSGGDNDKDKDEDDQHVMRMRNDDDDAGRLATAASPRGDRGKTAGGGAPQAWRQVVNWSLLCYLLLQLDVSSNNCEIIRAELVSGTEGIMCKQGQC